MRALIFFVLSIFASISFAQQQEAINAHDALKKLNKIMASPELTQKAYEAGEERITLCGYCHGKDGNSTRLHIPNLAEQTPVYLFNTFEKFANGEREDFVMSKAATMLDLDDRINIALYYGMQKVKHKEEVDPSLHDHAKAKFKQVCSACHGMTGEGHDEMPRIAGQPAEYVRLTLEAFRAGGEHRPGSMMIPFAQQLTDADIKALASYIQGLNP